jgi:hypothetical protein
MRMPPAKNNEENGGNGGGDMPVIRRVEKLEETTVGLRESVAEIKADVKHLATKSDVSEAKTAIVMWIVGTAIAVGALAFTIARVSSAPPAPQQPQIIVVPTQSAPAAPEPRKKP